MTHKQRTPIGITALCLLLFSACTPGPKATPTPTQLRPAEPVPPTAAPPAAQTLPPAEDKPPTITPASTSTAAPSSTDTPEPTPTLAVASDFVRRLCPHLTAPLGLFAAHEPYIDSSTDPETLYVIYQVEELGLDSPIEPCLLYLAPGPLGTPQLTGYVTLARNSTCIYFLPPWMFAPTYQLLAIPIKPINIHGVLHRPAGSASEHSRAMRKHCHLQTTDRR